MNKIGGFITLHRQILDWEWYGDTNTFRLFLHILLKANFADGRFEGREIKRGQLVTSLTSLSVETSLSVRQVRVSLDKLVMTGEVTNESTSRYRIITVVKYDDYQANDKRNDRRMTSRMTSKRQADDKPMTSDVTSEWQQYNNNNNNIYNKGTMEQEECRTASRFTPPTKEELFDFCLENQLGIDVDRFYDYYTSNGWKVGRNPMKDWKATVRNWAREKKEQPSRAAGKKVTAQEYTQRDYSSEDEAALRRMLEEA